MGRRGIKKKLQNLGLIKSPVCRNLRSSTKRIATKIANYDSPLKHLSHNISIEYSKPPTSETTKNVEKTTVKKEVEEPKEPTQEITEQDSDSDVSFSQLSLNFLRASPTMIKKKQEINKEDVNEDTTNDSFQIETSKKKRKKKVVPKKRRLKKSILSQLNETSKVDNSMDTIVLIEDSDNEKKPGKDILNKSLDNEEKKSNSVGDKSSNDSAICNKEVDSTLSNPDKKSLGLEKDEVVLVDDDSLMTEMNAYHEKFNLSTQSESKEPMYTDSVIILDHDDESPVKETNSSTKTNEDCLILWSSMASTSANDSVNKPRTPIDLDLLKQDKILIDSTPMNVNNENNKPKKKLMKPPKFNAKNVKYPSSILEKTKLIAAHTAKSAAKVAAKAKTKRKAKNNEDLIYSMSSKDGSSEKSESRKNKKIKLREVIIDGSNIGMAYTNGKSFSEKGIKAVIDYFTKKGHAVKVFIPQHRRSRCFPLLEKWYSDGIVVFTPSRKLGNKKFTPYDDRYILEYATACDGIVVSQDQFRDLYEEKPQYRDTIENRLLPPTFVGDYVMFPEDPLGRDGPTLTNFLKH